MCSWAVLPLLGGLSRVMLTASCGAGGAEPAWGRGLLHWAKTSMPCWNPDSTHGQNSASEGWCGCLHCSHGLAWRHAKDPGMYPRCLPVNKSSKSLEHCRVWCQYTAPPWRGTGSSLVLAVLEQSNCSVPCSSRAEYCPEEQNIICEKSSSSLSSYSASKGASTYSVLTHKLIQKARTPFLFVFVNVQLLNSNNYVNVEYQPKDCLTSKPNNHRNKKWQNWNKNKLTIK